MKPIVIYGAGGFGREVLELLRDINQQAPTWDILGFLEDSPEWEGKERNGVPVLGGASWLDGQAEPPAVVLALGSPVTRWKLHRQLAGRVAGFPSLIHPTVVLSRFVEVGEGVVITAGSVLTTDIRLAPFAMVNNMVHVGHDATVGAFATLSPGINVSGYVRIGEGCDLGAGVKIVPGVSIGAWSIVGAGAVVVRDLPANITAVGVPAKVIKEREAGWQNR